MFNRKCFLETTLAVFSALVVQSASAAEDECTTALYQNSAKVDSTTRFMPDEVIFHIVQRDLAEVAATPISTPLVPESTKLKLRYCVVATGDCVYEYPSGCLDGKPSTVADGLSSNMYACAGDHQPAPPPPNIKKITPNSILRFIQGEQTRKKFKKSNHDDLALLPELRALGAAVAWQDAEPNKEIITAVVDEGVDLDHPAFVSPFRQFDYSQLVAGVQIPCANPPCNGSPTTFSPHGTFLAGIIAAGKNETKILGTAWNTRVLPIASPHEHFLTDAAFSKSIDCAVKRGARVINASFQTDVAMPETEATMQRLIFDHKKNFLLVASAGNLNEDLNLVREYPATLRSADGKPFPNVVVVASHKADGAKEGRSSYGKDIVDIAAPGGAYSAIPCSAEPCYTGSATGTSNAAAYVSGAAALLWSRYPRWNFSDIKWRIRETGTCEPQLEPYLFPARRLNLARMMYPVSFHKANSNREISMADAGDTVNEIDVTKAFPVGMCSAVDLSLVDASSQSNSNPLSVNNLNPGDHVRIVASCTRTDGSPADVESSVDYTIIQ